MTQRELDILYAEAEAEVEAMWQEFMREWLAERGGETDGS